MTLAQVKAKNDPDDRILILNMEGNGYKNIITASPKNNWKWTHPFEKGDVRLEPLP